MSIVAVHGPYTFGSKGVTEVGPSIATVNPTNGLIWTFKLDQPSTRTASLAWTFPTGTPASATGPGPHVVTFAGAGTKAVTSVATGVGEGANPYPPAGTTNIPVTAVAGAAPSLLMSTPEEESAPEAYDADGDDDGYDPADYNVEEVKEYVATYPEYAADILELERAGKDRTTLVTFLEDFLADE